MSRTYRDIRKYHTTHFWRKRNAISFLIRKEYGIDAYSIMQNCIPYNEMEFISNKPYYASSQQLYTDYSSSPSWFRHLYDIKPARRQETCLLRKVLVNPQEADCLLFPLARKPSTYYW